MNRDLGLRPLGDVAFTDLWMLLVWLVPVLLIGLPDVAGVVLALLVLAAGLGGFSLSLLRLHGQMVRIKAAELAIARKLFAEAYEPVRAAPTLEALERQRNHVAAADALERRARAIHDWPIDGHLRARPDRRDERDRVTVALILDPLGL